MKILWSISLPHSLSTDLPNKVAIPAPTVHLFIRLLCSKEYELSLSNILTQKTHEAKYHGFDCYYTKSQHKLGEKDILMMLRSFHSIHEHGMSLHIFFFSLQGRTCGTRRAPGEGLNRSCRHWSTPQPRQRGIRAPSGTRTAAHGNAPSS